MAIYAIADIHLPGGGVKPMDIFGEHWKNHAERIEADWRARVSDQDVVLIPGDTSWAMTLPEALADLRRIGALPGRKILLRGNHDFWWSAIGRVRAALPAGMWALQNDCLLLDGTIFCGTRGWLLPTDTAGPDDLRVYQRELLRLEMALTRARAVSWELPVVCMLHYPPLTDAMRDTGFTALIEKYQARDVVYGHLHGASLRFAFRGEHRGVRYHQVSCDGLDFRLYALEPRGTD